MNRFKAQFFSDVTEIRMDMEGITGTGKLVLKFRTPIIRQDDNGNGDDDDLDLKDEFSGNVTGIVDLLDKLSNYIIIDEQPNGFGTKLFNRHFNPERRTK